MLTGGGLSAAWRHDRAHRFFSQARWNTEALGLVLAKLIVSLLVPDGEPVLVLRLPTNVAGGVFRVSTASV